MEKKLTQAQLRAAFWQGFPHYRSAFKRGKRQNEYNATIRSEWIEFVDMMARGGHITDRTANNATL